MNYRPMFTFNGGERRGNAQVFATREEAHGSAASRFAVWTMPTGYGVDETEDSVTYRWDSDEGDVRLPLGQESV